MHKRSRGVTLIELMVVVAIAAILASIAFSSYRNSVIRSNRTEATAQLLRIAAAQERFFLQNNRYADDDELTLASPAGLGVERTTSSGYYTIALTSGDAFASQYTITATPADDGGMVDDEKCTSFSVNESGQRDAEGVPDARTLCWR